jgi:carbon-monoxide dehydrogenase large subunit
MDTTRAEKAPGVRAVVTGEDTRGVLYGRRYRDLSVLAHGRVRFLGERVAAVAAEERDAAQEALDLIRVEYEELPAVLDPIAALQEGAALIHPEVNTYPGLPEPLDKPSNAYFTSVVEKGNLEEGFAQADVIVENTFTVSRVHQAFLETHCCMVWIDDQGKIQVWSSSKAPHTVKQTLSDALSIPKDNIRVNPVAIGGDFGGKGGALDEPLCYFLALRSGRPVKMVMDYQEEFTAGAPRHAAILKMKTGVKRDGTLVAHQMDSYFDSGAYGGLRPGAAFTGATHSAGCYRIPHARVSLLRIYTNNIPGGQMRAPSEPQGFFAAESQMDCVARSIGMDPLEFRLKNLIEQGETTVGGEHYEEIRAKETLNAAVKAAGYRSPKARYLGRGIAMGFRAPGGGSTSLSVTLNQNGTVVIQTAFLEQGTWTYTSLRQVVAEELGLNPEEIQVKVLDTDSSPFDSGIGGSRGTRIGSRAAFEAARAAKEELFGLAERLLGWPKSELLIQGNQLIHKKTKQRQRWDEMLSRVGRSITRQAINRDEGHAPVTSFTAQVAEVEVDPETGQVALRRFTTAHDTGTILNPIGHQGQIEGGIIQGVGYGLMEEVQVEEGRVTTTHFGDYKVPNIKDIPPLRTVILPTEAGIGPYNVKGIGENPISPVAPAIANAIEDAVGVRMRNLPITAEKVYAALREQKKRA